MSVFISKIFLLTVARAAASVLPTGITLPPVSPSEPCVFRDLFLQAGPWFAEKKTSGSLVLDSQTGFSTESTDEILDLDSKGYPINSLPADHVATAVVLDSYAGICGAVGSFTVTWTGAGSVSLTTAGIGVGIGAKASNTLQTTACGSNSCTALVLDNGGNSTAMEKKRLHIHITSLPVSNLQILPGGGSEVFSDWFVNAITQGGFSVIRATAWQRIEYAKKMTVDETHSSLFSRSGGEGTDLVVPEWQAEPASTSLPGSGSAASVKPTQQGTWLGVSLNYLTLLAQKTNTSLWIAFPHGRTETERNNFVSAVQKMVTDYDVPHVYVEFSGHIIETTWQEVDSEAAALFTALKQSIGPQQLTTVFSCSTCESYRIGESISSWAPKATAAGDAISIQGSYGQIVTSNWGLGAQKNPSLVHFENAGDETELQKAINATKNVEKFSHAMRQSQLAAEYNLVEMWHRVKEAGKKLFVTDAGAFAHAPYFLAGSDTKGVASKKRELQSALIRASSSSSFRNSPDLAQNQLEWLDLLERIGIELALAPSLVDAPVDCSNGREEWAWSYRPATHAACGFAGLSQNASDFKNSQGVIKAWTDFASGTRVFDSITSYTDVSNKPNITCFPPCADRRGICDTTTGTCVCYFGFSGGDCSSDNGTHNPSCRANTPLGMGLNGIDDWSRERVFVDFMKSSRGAVAQNVIDPNDVWDLGEEHLPSLSSVHGYPDSGVEVQQAIGILMARDLEGHYPAGTYELLYDGDGTFDVTFDVRGILSREKGRWLLNVVPQTSLNNGIFIKVIRSNPLNPLKNFRLLMPGFTSASGWRADLFPFHPMFLESVKRYSALRFQAWMLGTGASHNPDYDIDWANRTTPYFRTQISDAPTLISIEYIVQLCNTLGTNICWINIIHRATDDYVLNMAKLMSEQLRTDTTVYVEYSNEVWGTGASHPGGDYAEQQATALGLSGGRMCYLAKRTKEIKDIFVTNMPEHTVKSVVGSQACCANVAEDMFTSCSNTDTESIDVLAIAPFFELASLYASDGSGRLLTLDEVFEPDGALDEGIATAVTSVEAHRVVAWQHGLELAAYEAGPGIAPGLSGGSTDAIAFARQIHQDSRMQGAVKQYLSALETAGTNLTMYYSSCTKDSKYGSWGLREAIDLPDSERSKVLGVLDYLREKEGDVSTASCAARAGPHSVFSSASSDCSCTNATVGICTTTGFSYGWNTPETPNCHCFFGYDGADCSDTATYLDISPCNAVDPSVDWDCSERGECVIESVGILAPHVRNWGCKCESGYSGFECGLFSCPNDCHYNGECVGPNQCKCFPGFAGGNCEIDCGCDGHGICSPDNSKCLCKEPGYVTNSTGQCEVSCSCPAIGASNANTVKTGNTHCNGPLDCKSCGAGCNNGDCFAGSCVCWAGYSGSDCSQVCVNGHDSGSAETPIVGFHLELQKWWSEMYLWGDLMKTADGWGSQHTGGDVGNSWEYGWDDGRKVEISSNGYPTKLIDSPMQSASMLLLRDVNYNFPSWASQSAVQDGRYVLLYKGKGWIELSFDAKVVSRREGRIDFDVTLSQSNTESAYDGYDNGVHLRITRTDKSDPIRDIRVIMPPPVSWREQTGSIYSRPAKAKSALAGHVDTMQDDPAMNGWAQRISRLPFHPEYAKHIANAGVLRMMNWELGAMDTDWDKDLKWSDRTTPKYMSQAGGGHGGAVAVEHQIAMCNLVGSDCWFVIPHRATDDYVQGMAKMVSLKLRSDVKAIVEWSNEVWGHAALHPGGVYARKKGLEENLGGGDGYTAQFCYYAKRTLEVAKIFKKVFSSSSSRIQSVVSTQAASSGSTDTVLKCLSDLEAADASLGMVDALAIAPYFDATLTNSNTGDLLSADDVLRAGSGTLEQGLKTAFADTETHKTSLDTWNNARSSSVPAKPTVAFWAYEAGPAIAPGLECTQNGGSACTDKRVLAREVHRDPRMEGFVDRYLTGLKSRGMSRIVYFTSASKYGLYGNFGVKENVIQEDKNAPKLMAVRKHLVDANRRTKCAAQEAGPPTFEGVVFMQGITKPQSTTTKRADTGVTDKKPYTAATTKKADTVVTDKKPDTKDGDKPKNDEDPQQSPLGGGLRIESQQAAIEVNRF